MATKPVSTPNTKSVRTSRFGKVAVIALLLILGFGCLGTLSICYLVATRGVDVRIDNNGQPAAATTTQSPNIIDALCIPFGSAFFKLLSPTK